MELGKLIHDSDQLMQLGMIHAVSKDMIAGLSQAEQLLKEYTKVPPIARLDAKLKGRKSILDQMNESAMKDVVDSIYGQEFQSTAKSVLNRKI